MAICFMTAHFSFRLGSLTPILGRSSSIFSSVRLSRPTVPSLRRPRSWPRHRVSGSMILSSKLPETKPTSFARSTSFSTRRRDPGSTRTSTTEMGIHSPSFISAVPISANEIQIYAI